MRSTLDKSILIVLALILIHPLLAADTRGVLRIRITDVLGATIEGGYVLIHPDVDFGTSTKLRKEVRGQTSKKGLFEAQLEPGFYDVCVMALAFTPTCKKVLVTPEKVAQLEFPLKLDPLVSGYIGDTLPTR